MAFGFLKKIKLIKKADKALKEIKKIKEENKVIDELKVVTDEAIVILKKLKELAPQIADFVEEIINIFKEFKN